MPITAYYEKLSSPVHLGEIYQAANQHSKHLSVPGAQLSILLSPGTPAMQAVWILLGKTRYPATFYQSSFEQGVLQVEVPFEIAAEYVPAANAISTDKLVQLGGLREEGLTVYGFGEEKTPRPFVSACDKFIYTELLRGEVLVAASNGHGRPEPEPPAEIEAVKVASTPEVKKLPKAPVSFIAKILDDIADEDGWAHLGALGTNISKLRPEFDPRTHGYKKLSELIKGYPDTFELQTRGASGVGGSILYTRHRQPSS